MKGSATDQVGRGHTVEEAVLFLKQCEGLIDILQVRLGDMNLNHPTGYTQEKGAHLSLPHAEAIKKSGVKMLIAPNGGFQDLDFNEAWRYKTLDPHTHLTYV